MLRSLVLTSSLGLFFLASIWNAEPIQAEASFEEVGNFYLQNYAPEDIGGHAQSWALAQDARDFLYVGNNYGILEFDGVAWRLIQVPNRSSVRSLAADSDGRIFVGADNELGYLAPDELGATTFVSLLEYIAPEDRAFAEVWRTHVLSDGVYFQTRHRIFRWHDGVMDVWTSEEPLVRSFAVHDTVYADSTGDTLYALQAGELQPILGSRLSESTPVALLPWDNGSFLAVTQSRGLQHCLPNSGMQETELNISCTTLGQGLAEHLASLDPYYATWLDNGLVAIGTRLGGLAVVDSDGRLIRTVDTTSGLRSDQVWFVHADREGGLWLALNDGLARIDVTSDLSFFDASNGLAGMPLRAARHRGRFYVATSQGVFALRPQVAATARFEATARIEDFCWSLLSTEQGLLAGCDGGLYDVDRDRWIWRDGDAHIFALHRSRNDPRHVFAGLEDGLAQLTLGDQGWQMSGRFQGVSQVIRSLAEDDRGQLWMGTATQGVLGMSTDASLDDAEIQVFGEDHGLPSDWLEPFIVAGQVRIWAAAGQLFRWNDGAQHFEPDPTLAPGEDAEVQSLAEDEAGRVWIASQASVVAEPNEDGSYRLRPSPWRKDERMNAIAVLAEPGGPIWAVTTQHLVRLDPNGTQGPLPPLRTWIRRAATLDGTPLFEGSDDLRTSTPLWPYSQGSLRFTFAAPQMAAPDRTQYRVRLDGLDEDWSAWTDETRKDYTKLWEGRYTFRVQAQDIYGRISAEDALAFRIAPPWFRSVWAYGLYALACILALVLWNRRHRQELQRERQAADRERAINAKLREVDRLKDAFLATTSHELRTPLYGMTGLAESLIGGVAGDLPKAANAHLGLLVQSGQRLSKLVDDLLDVSKLQQEKMELRREAVDLHALADVVLTLSRPLVGTKDVELVLHVPTDLPPAWGDANRLHQVLHNLVGNAIKFTEEGQVEVSARLAGELLEVRVMDTGLGIAEDQLQRIFEPFVQADDSIQRRVGGSGLGLAVSRQLVELHGGSLQAESIAGKGSVFSFTVPPADSSAPEASLDLSSRTTAPTLHPMDLEPDPTLLAPKPAPSTDQAKILVVDDEPIVRRVLENHLVSAGYQVTTAASGAEAIAYLGEDHADLVLLDIMMPEMSGHEVCRTIRTQHAAPSLPILFLSAMSRTEDRITALEQGGNDYLSKPIAKAELLARVVLHLEVLEAHRRQQDQIETLQNMLPICMCCKKVRDDEGYWGQIEEYIHEHFGAEFTHGICPSCAEDLLSQVEN